MKNPPVSFSPTLFLFSPVAALSLPPERASPLKMEEMGRRELTTPREKKEKVSPPASPHFRLGLSVNSVSPYTETFSGGETRRSS